MKLLVCGLTDERGECTIDFAITILQLPFAFVFERMHLVYASSPKEIFADFLKSEFDVLFCCPSNRASMAFIQRAVGTSHDFIVGMEPIPQADFGRIAQGLSATTFNFGKEDVKMQTRTPDGFIQLKKSYDMVSSFPNTFVYKKGDPKVRKQAWLDVQAPFSSTGKTEFAGCVKYRFMSQPAIAATATNEDLGSPTTVDS
jgi:hypothetical protein